MSSSLLKSGKENCKSEFSSPLLKNGEENSTFSSALLLLKSGEGNCDFSSALFKSREVNRDFSSLRYLEVFNSKTKKEMKFWTLLSFEHSKHGETPLSLLNIKSYTKGSWGTCTFMLNVYQTELLLAFLKTMRFIVNVRVVIISLDKVNFIYPLLYFWKIFLVFS